VGREAVRFDDEVSVLVGVAEAMKLLRVVCFRPTQSTARGTGSEGGGEIYEHVRIRYRLPHVWNVRVLLGDVAAPISKRLEQAYEGRFAGTAGSHHPNQDMRRI
jgi:hypothetical protein